MTKDEFEAGIRSYMNLPPAEAVDSAKKLISQMTTEEYDRICYDRDTAGAANFNPVFREFTRKFAKHVIN